jgi:hypothetical protein
MSHRARLQPFAETVKAAGLAGKSMQDALRKVAHANDLTPHQIHRVAEIANREVQLALQKTASDKRFKFELADPFAITGDLAKTASAPEVRDGLEGELAKVAALGGDPFAAPDLSTGENLSLYQQPIEPDIELQQRASKLAATIAQLRGAEAETAALLDQAKTAKMEIYRDAVGSHKQAVDDAVELVMGGITLPSLYQALTAAVSGSAATEADRAAVDNLALLIIQGVKDRGIPNHRMGFRYQVDIGQIDALSADDLVALCKRAVGCDSGCGDLTMQTQKSAARYLESIAELHALGDKQPYEEANKWLSSRGAITQYPLQQGYLDEKQTANQTGADMRMINGDSEFIIAVKDLVGAQDRMRKNHNAAEYLGLKLKQIQEAIGGLKNVHEKTAELLEEHKAAFLGGLISKGVAAIEGSALGKGLAGGAGMAINNGVGIAGGGLNAVAAKQQIDMNRREAANQQSAPAKQTALM